MGSTPTLVHVAKLAGVGLGTASRALSGQGYVREETLDRIRQAAKILGYQRNELARSLKVHDTGTIGIVVPDIGGKFMATCVRALQKELRRAGYTSIIAFTDGDEKIEAEEISYLTRYQVSGILIVPANSDAAHFRSAQLQKIPIVAFDQPISSGDADAVLLTNRNGAKTAVEHLIAHGHTRIACLGMNRRLYSMRQRLAGYRAAMKAANLQPLFEMLEGEDGAGEVLDRWFSLDTKPTAIFTLNELTSLQTVQMLAERKLNMPDDVAFITFDDIDLGSHLDPALTVVVQPAAAIGECAAKRLLARIKSANDMPARRFTHDATLILRGSCGCPEPQRIRYDNPLLACSVDAN